MTPIPLAKRQAMQDDGDYTVNAVGPSNETPVSTLKVDGTTLLVDSFVRDGWIAPENRLAEIAALQQSNKARVEQELREVRDSADRAAYAKAWVARWLNQEMVD